jgi:cytoskeleton protein RodZ
MTIESFQDTLFEDPIGLRFRHAREKARWSLESVAQQLKLPVSVLDAIEREDWGRLGAPIFVRSYVGSYAKLLGLPSSLADDVVKGKPAPQLVSIGGTPVAKRAYNRSSMNVGYLVMTILIVAAVVALAVYFQSPKRSVTLIPLDASDSYATMAPADTPAPVAPKVSMPSPAAAEVLAAAPSDPLPPSSHGAIVIRFRGDSWVDLVDHAGVHLERGLVPAGTERRFEARQLARVTLGDATAVDVSLAGAQLDLTPFREANVARFTVSSDGRIASN